MGFPNTNNLPAVNQYDVNRSIISPIFLGQDYMQYMNVLPNIKGTTKIDHFGSLTKITKGFNEGAFSGETAGTFSAVTVSPARMEAEIEFYANSLFGKMKGQLMRDNFDFDNIDGTIVKNVLLDLISQGIKADFNRQVWLGDASLTSGTGYLDYSEYDGIFQVLKDGLAAAQKLDNSDITGVGNDEGLDAAADAVNILTAMYEAATPELLEAGNHVFFVSGDIADKYMAYLEGTGYAAAGHGVLVNGVPSLSWRGIPIVVRRDWDTYLAADTAILSGASDAAETHRAVLTTQDAIIVGTDFDETSVEQWYSQDNKSYRFRVSYMVGVALADAKLAVAYSADSL